MSLGPRTSDLQYWAYGLTLRSDILLAELRSSTRDPEQPADIRIRFSGGRTERPSQLHWFRSWFLPSGELWLRCGKAGNGYLLQFPDLAEFSVDAAGRNIVVLADPETPPETLGHLLLDQVLPLVLTLRGSEALHASAILTPFGVCAFTGPSGAGKSTLAASFLGDGYPLLTDDCLRLDSRGSLISAVPAYPGLRLWQDTVEALYGDVVSSHPVAHYTSKRRVHPDSSSEGSPGISYPVRGIYALVRQEDTDGNNSGAKGTPQISGMSRRDGLMTLISSAFMLDIMDRARLAEHFHFFRRLALQVPVRLLCLPNSLASLSAIREAILGDLARL